MYRNEREINLIKKINNYNLNIEQNEESKKELTELVCQYFDEIKNENLEQLDLQFLRYIANIVGIPQYFEILKNFKNRNISDLEIKNINLLTLSNFIHESCLSIDKNIVLHKYQMEIYNLFKRNIKNRYFLTAPTSFGKTFLIYPLISKMNYNNILLIFPTIALLSENFKKIINNKNLMEYRIHTLSKIKNMDLKNKNIFIFTPERFLSYLDNNEKIQKFDFIFIDEIYKIDNEFTENNEVKENERDLAYRLAIYNAFKYNKNSDILLCGPYINCGDSFKHFLEYNRIKLLNFNKIDLVNKKYIYKNKDKKENDKELINSIFEIIQKNENCIIYTSGPSRAESIAKNIIKSELKLDNECSYNDFIEHLENNFNKDWILVKSLKCGIGIHHGSIPKYIQNTLIELFNDNKIKILISTTTITEGVNTNAKNIIIESSKKGKKDLKKFDAENIVGRAGRFGKHYAGNVIILENKFHNIINSNDILLQHRNFDFKTIKTEQEIFDVNNNFLNIEDKKNKENLLKIKDSLNSELVNCYKVVTLKDKEIIYNIIKNKLQDDKIFNKIKNNIKEIKKYKYKKENLDFIYYICPLDIIKNAKLKALLSKKSLSGLICSFLINGLNNMIKYNVEKNNYNIDKAIRNSCELVYQTFKYHLVKYLGIFNICYKIIIAEKNKMKIDDVEGIDFLLKKLEYGAFSDNGIFASDFGMPLKIIEYYENNELNKKKAIEIKENFDKFEKIKFKEIEEIINKNQEQ